MFTLCLRKDYNLKLERGKEIRVLYLADNDLIEEAVIGHLCLLQSSECDLCCKIINMC